MAAIVFPATPALNEVYPPWCRNPWSFPVGLRWHKMEYCPHLPSHEQPAGVQLVRLAEHQGTDPWVSTHRQPRRRCAVLGNPGWTLHLSRRPFRVVQRNNQYLHPVSRGHSLLPGPSVQPHHRSRRYRSDSGHLVHNQRTANHVRPGTSDWCGIRRHHKRGVLRVKPSQRK